tara:strand:- start:56 stop:487 length:432 start_codon:yes stop_codon:yes gene_type:complete
MKFYNWKSSVTRDLVIMKAVGGSNGGYIIEAETKTAVKYINKLMQSIQHDGLDSKWISIDQVEENALFIDSKKVFLQFMDVILCTDFVVDDHAGYMDYMASECANTYVAQNKPKEGKVYALTGGPGANCISNGNSWSDSEVPQ